MERKGLLVNYRFCDNCSKCVLACCNKTNDSKKKPGLVISASGPFKLKNGGSVTYYIASPTDYCDQCKVLNHNDGRYMCVEACTHQCLIIGSIIDLKEKMTNVESALFSF